MIQRFLFYVSLALTLHTAARGQARVGEWQIYSSILNARQQVYSDGRLFVATNGGVLEYDHLTGEIEVWDINNGLINSNIAAIDIEGRWLWLGGDAPDGLIQLANLDDGTVSSIRLDLGEIIRIVARPDGGMVAFQDGQKIGLVELRWNGEGYEFFDIYRNFPQSPAVIRDLDMEGDSVFVLTEKGVIGNNIRLANLKDPSTWDEVAPIDIIQYHVDSTGHYMVVADGIYARENSQWRLIRSGNLTATRQFTRRSDGEFLVAISNYGLIYNLDGSVKALPRQGGQVTSFVDAPELGGGFIAMRNHGLIFYDYPTGTISPLLPNTMAGPSYSAIRKLSNGDLIAAGTWGLTRFNGKSWYNIVPGLSLSQKVLEDRVNGSSLVEESDQFLADTLVFRGKQVWNLLELPDGDILMGFRGNPVEGVGIMRLDLDDVAAHEDFDTTDGIIDALADGFMTVRHLVEDDAGNIWVTIPFGQITLNPIAVYKPDGQWSHFSLAETGGALTRGPTEIAFDSLGRVWIANEVNGPSITGGISVLDYNGTLDDHSDDEWTILSAKLEADHSNSVWSIVIDHTNVLWAVTPNGIMGYNILPGPTLEPALGFGMLLGDVPFGEGSKIRVDVENNKWITTPGDGLWVLLNNTTFWPSVDGFTTANSPLPSDEILDIYLDDKEGKAYLATSLGIAVLRIPFKETVKTYSGMRIFPSPFRIPADRPMIVDGIRQGSTVKIFTASGGLVRELKGSGIYMDGYQARWDGRNDAGEFVGSGVYLVAAFLPAGESGLAKVAVIRR